MLRNATALLAAILILSLATSNAYAVPPPPIVEPMRCIAEWNENDNYVGEGWVAARVGDVNGVFLGCGDERSGLIHIAHPESTGTVHPVWPHAQFEFLRCFELIAKMGVQKPDNNFPGRSNQV